MDYFITPTELTKALEGEAFTPSAMSGATLAANSSIKIGKLVCLNIKLSIPTLTTSVTTIGTIPEGFRPAAESGVFIHDEQQNAIYKGWITAGGSIRAQSAQAYSAAHTVRIYSTYSTP